MLRHRNTISGLLICVLAGFLGARASAQTDWLWERVNPGGGGWFERCAAGPTGLVIACSDLGGAYVSHDRGKTWSVVGSAHGLGTTHASCVAFHPSDPEIVFLGTEDGIYTSTSFAAQWTHALRSGYVESIGVSTSDAKIAYAAVHTRWNVSTCHIYRTADRGQTWVRVDRGFPAGHRVLEVLVDAIDPQRVYALSGEGRFATGPSNVFTSADGGATWSAIGAGFTEKIVDIAVDPWRSGTILASVDDARSSQRGHLYRSTNHGAQWTEIARIGGHIWHDRATRDVVRAIDGRYLFPWDAREGIWESKQGGSTGSWVRTSSVATWAAGWSTAFWALGATSNYGAFGEDYSDSQTLYWVNGQFAFATFDGGRSVQQVYTNDLGNGRWRSRGFDNIVSVDLSISPAKPSHIYAGFLDVGAWRSLDGGQSWSSINDKTATGSWSGAGGNTLTILADPKIDGAVWASQGEAQSGPASLLYSKNHGTTWTRVGTGLPVAPLSGLSIDPSSKSDTRRMFLSAGGDIYGSEDHGKSWSQRHTGKNLYFTHVDANDPSRVYAAGSGGLHMSPDFGRAGTWIEVGNEAMLGHRAGLPDADWSGCLDIETHAQRPDTVYVAVRGRTGGGVWRGDPRGKTWTQILADPFLRAIEIDPKDPSTIYATTSAAVASGGYDPRCRGVLRSTDDGRSWQAINANLAWNQAGPLALGPFGTRVVIGVPGSGLHRNVVRRLTCDRQTISVANGGRAVFQVQAPPQELFVLLSSTSGSTPGQDVGLGQILPLNYDAFTVLALGLANTPVYINSVAATDAQGNARSELVLPGGIATPLLGKRLSFACLTVSEVTNAVSIVLTR